MYKNSPKLMIKIQLLGEKELKMTLLFVDKYFETNHKDSNLFISTSGFTVYRGTLFILFKNNSIHIPKNFLIGNNSIISETFVSDKDRYEFLKKLKSALLEWSNSKFWVGFTQDEKVKLTFRNEVWLLF